jgi:hypothetical protein
MMFFTISWDIPLSGAICGHSSVKGKETPRFPVRRLSTSMTGTIEEGLPFSDEVKYRGSVAVALHKSLSPRAEEMEEQKSASESKDQRSHPGSIQGV